jgi:hypothetical protein
MHGHPFHFVTPHYSTLLPSEKFLTKVFDVYTNGGIQVPTSKPYKVILGDWTTLIINIKE